MCRQRSPIRRERSFTRRIGVRPLDRVHPQRRVPQQRRRRDPERDPPGGAGPLDTLPFPDVDVFYKYPFLRSKRVMQVHASRGCRNSCTYCSVGTMKKDWVSGMKSEKFNRTKSVDYLCEKMNDILARLIHVTDASRLPGKPTPKQWTCAFCVRDRSRSASRR
jgi:radical SAM superfamily enzyme YgiQ (UPF0313 family)